jgi:hypothetical protein
MSIANGLMGDIDPIFNKTTYSYHRNFYLLKSKYPKFALFNFVINNKNKNPFKFVLFSSESTGIRYNLPEF